MEQTSNLEKEAIQAFQETFGATPEKKGFPEVKEKNPKVIFADSYESLKDYETGEKEKQKAVLFTTSIVVIAAIAALILYDTPRGSVCVIMIIVVTLGVLLLQGKQIRKRLKNIKALWKGKLLIYDARTQEFYE